MKKKWIRDAIHLAVKTKMWKIMRLSVIFLFLLISQVWAESGYSQQTKLTLKMENARVIDVLDEIENKSEFFFLLNQKLVDVERKVDVNAKEKSIDKILNNLFYETDVTYQVNDRLIILTTEKSDFYDGVSSQQKSISGKVSDEDGEPLPGVTVFLKGTTQGTITNADGNYTITNIPSGATLVFSFVGMLTQEVNVTEQNEIHVTMIVDAIGLEEVVVTALGIKREQKALGYSVQQVDGESLQKVSGVDVGTSLTGKVAGVLVQNSSDFNVEPTFTIRGETDPLIVIDGVAYSNKKLNDIAAEDIESMTVLKGATASALYGFRGEKGAILITTKNGSTGDTGVSVDVTSSTMFNAGFLAIPEKQSVYGRGTAYIYDLNSDQSWGTFMDGSMQTQWDPITKEFRDYEYLPVGANNFENFLEIGYITNNNVSVAFKGENVALRTSLNWTQNKGRYPNSKLDKYTYTLGGDINLDKFKLTSNMSYTKRESPNMGSNGYTSYDPMYTLLIWSSADFDIRQYKDNYWIKPGQLQNNHFGYDYEADKYRGKNQNNPYYDRYERTNEVSRDIFNADLTMSYDIADWLKATVRSGLDFYIDRGQLRISQGSYTSSGNTGVPGNPYTWNGSRTGAYLTGKTQGFSINSDMLLTGNKSFLEKFDVEYLAGGTIFYDRNDNINAKTVGGISIPGYFSLNASVNPATVAESTVARQVNSLYGRMAFSWNKLIYLDLTGRNDWVSMLANPNVDESDRSYFYPSVSGSFVVSELLPESTQDWLDLLKLRGSWTRAKTAPSPYAINSVFSVYPGTWNDQNGASAPSALYLNSYSPNSYTTKEIGLQGMMFQKRLTVDLTYYSKHIFDILKQGPLSSASGYTGIYLNTDEERTNKGWEVALTGTPVKTKDLQWDINVNWSTYKQEYTKLDSLYTSNFGKPWVNVGDRTDAFTLKDYLRVPYGEYAGQQIYNTSGRVVRSSYTTLYGYSNPDWLWGISSSLRYKNFSLYMSFDGVAGGLLSTRTESYMWQSGVHPESVTEERALDVADPGSKNYVGEGVQVISGSVTYDTNGNITSDTREYAPNDVASTYKQAAQDLHNTSAWGGSPNPNDVYSRTFLKLRELSLTYTIPNSVLNNWAGGFIENASVSFVGQNVLFWSKDWKYSDPDGGYEDFADPSVRYLGANIKLTF
ncbi:SusC/RagA family TonB-linked outer membrane protein [Prolixibacteraceae bacterium Z1-6]|uniref:SusC/RagA family TonB-linked outer membrane protein n=1 Tax=Draconibacterium aestuarii TaxID=2998507 RepID=A0A9X3F242_9BACT|nr:SusC/RagA family TonB-linked outer membrane protein [Prolixibacteraceae bacterium Z1-6]